jgi:hypothetical protein
MAAGERVMKGTNARTRGIYTAKYNSGHWPHGKHIINSKGEGDL